MLKRVAGLSGFFLLLTAGFVLSSGSADISYFDISKNLEIMTSLYKELNTWYADSLHPDKLNRAGLSYMLDRLDPYTEFIPDEETEDYRTQMTGRYGGIGALISKRDDWVVISEPYDGFPAALAGLRAGDRILEVDGISAKGKNTDEVSRILRGKPNTQVKVKYSRLEKGGIEKNYEVSFTRLEIKIKNVSYSGMLNDSVGYIRLAQFTDRASQEVISALSNLEKKQGMKSLILDLRGNPGGLLHEAINVSNIFTEKYTQIVSTKGKLAEWNRNYQCLNDPVDTKIPLVVLTDGGSASASEIVAGSLQDLDRAVVIGQKTFGKGLVQSTLDLPYNGKLKYTSAKYYIPSGRCIQAINYNDKDSLGSVQRVPDSLRAAFKTRNGRTVLDGSGIEPDLAIEPEKMTQITFSLFAKNILFDYATRYRAEHNTIAPASSFRLTDAEYEDFMAFARKQDYSYRTTSEKVLEEIKRRAKEEELDVAIQQELEQMEKTLNQDKEKDLIKNKAQICSLLEEEIAARFYGNQGRTENAFHSDHEVTRALELLSKPAEIKKMLSRK